MKKNLLISFWFTLVTTVIFGFLYPLAVTGLAQVLFRDRANGQLIERDGKIVGSRIIGQAFTAPGYFHSRPSNAGTGYDPTASGGSYLAPTNKNLIERVKGDVQKLQAENPGSPIPVDLVTSSGSGLDSDISPAAAEFQIPRVAHSRGMSQDDVRALVQKHTKGRDLGFLGEPRVNVLELNLELARNVGAAPADGPTYLGFDLNTYPGDQALPILRKTFSFAGYWLSPPPGEKQNSWSGKRATLRAEGFGFLVLYRGPHSRALKSLAQSAGKGTADARTAIASAKKEGFPPHVIIFLDIEEGGRLPPNYHNYLRAWLGELIRAGYRAGFYSSGMPVNEGQGVITVTADDIRDHLAGRQIVYWVYNDACPPSPGCARPLRPPFPSASGVSYAAVWQFAQSPRRKEFTSRCAATYHTDGNCYAPGDVARAWFLDLNAATTPDPSAGGN